MSITYSNPRMHAEFNDWPLGGSKRGRCVFNIEYAPKRGFRVTRTTTGKPKVKTYGGQACIVDGSDGRTYILQKAPMQYGFITISRSDFMDEGTVWPDGNPESYAELDALIREAQQS